MKITVFDIETYKHLFCYCSITYDSETRQKLGEVTVADDNGMITKEIFKRIEADFAQADYIVSYNGRSFDLPVLAKMKRDIACMGDTTTKLIYCDAMEIIRSKEQSYFSRKFNYRVQAWSAKHFDLFNNCLMSKSLKQWEMYCGLPIMELPYDPETELTPEMKKEIAEYCMHDVWATSQILWKFGYDDMGTSNGTGHPTLMAYIELLKLWPDHLPFKFDRTPQTLSSGIIYGTLDAIPPKTNNPLELFDIKQFDVPLEVKLIISSLANNNLKFEPEFNGIKYGKGGAHYIKKGLHRDVHVFDVASQYPSVIENWKLLKTDTAQSRWSEIKQLRLAVKKAKDKPYLDKALKLVLNSLSGGFRIRCAQSVAYDPAVGEAMCYIAQLFITEVAMAAPDQEGMIEVNTDSVFVTGEENVKALRAKAEEVKTKYNMLLEEEVMDMVYFRDVNNYVIYDKDGKLLDGRGQDWKDMKEKASEPAVQKELFKNLIRDTLENDWASYDWKDFIFKYHKSAASKYAAIGEEPMKHKNYYFLWTTKDCPDAKPIAFSRDLVNKKNGSIKARYGVYAFDINDLEKYKGYIDYSQYQRDLDDLFELWGREDLCTTRLPKDKSKQIKSLADVIKTIYEE